MQVRHPVKRLVSGVILLSAAVTVAGQAREEAEFVRDGKAGFVVSSFRYAVAQDASETGACPVGMTEGYANRGEVFVGRDDLEQRDGEKEDLYLRRLFGVAFSDDSVSNLCLNPELGEPDPRYRTVTGEGVAVEGIDLDGHHSTRDNTPRGAACPHDDFAGVDGDTGVDNEFYRLVGCNASFQSTGLSNSFDIEMLTGSWGILITLSGVDDIANDDDVGVGVYANADPIQLSPGREPLPWATYAMHPEPRYRSLTRGRIRDGVLTTDPVDLRIQWVVNSIREDRPLQRARVRMSLSEEGVLDGYLAGYTKVDDLYNYMFGFRTGTDGTGQLAPLRLRAGSSIGKAFVLGYTCEGAWQAMHALADADPDPETGACTSISTQYRLQAIPAFVVSEASAGSNDVLDAAGFRRMDGYDAGSAATEN